MIPNGLGFYIWKLNRVLPLERLIQTLQAVNARWVCLKLADGPDRYNRIDESGNLVGNDTFLKEVIQALRLAIPGIQIGGWGWIFTREMVAMVRQASVAAERCATLGLDFWFIDAEEHGPTQTYWKTSPYRSLSAREYMDLGQSLGIKSPSLSSYRFPKAHPEFPWDDFLNHPSMEYTAPQMYWMGAHNPRYQLGLCLSQYAQKRELPMVPIGAAFKEGGWTTTAADIAEFTQAVQDFECPGWGFWVLDQAIDRPDWLAAMAHDYTPPPVPAPEPTPEPEPEPAPQLVEIIGLDDDQTLNMRSRIWGDVVAKTWNGAQFPVMDTGQDGLDRPWYQLGPGIWVASWYTQPVNQLPDPEPDPEPDPIPDPEPGPEVLWVRALVQFPLGIAVQHDQACKEHGTRGKPTIEHPKIGRIIIPKGKKIRIYAHYKYSCMDNAASPVIRAAGNKSYYVAVDGYPGQVSFVRKDLVELMTDAD